MTNSRITYTREDLSQKIGINISVIENNVSLARKTWIHRGGVANWWFNPTNYDELLKIGKFLYEEQYIFDVIGHTSNIYFNNNYHPDVILDTRHLKTVLFQEEEIICEAGTPVKIIARECIERGICGYEGFVDLPGTIGAAVVNNSGCFGCEISKVVKEIELLTQAGVVRLSNADLNYTHRNSKLKSKEMSGIVLRVYLDASNKTKDINLLQKKAAKNHEIRVTTQEKPSHNLGSTFANTTLKKGCQYYIIGAITKLLNVLRYKQITILKVRKYTYLILQNKLYLARYISDKNLNTYLFLDEQADAYFQDYIRFIEAIYENPKLEIEIKY